MEDLTMTDIQQRRPGSDEAYGVHHLVGPEFYPLYGLVLRIVLAAVIGAAIGGLKLTQAISDRATQALNLTLQLAAPAVAGLALSAGHWVSAQANAAKLAPGMNIGAETALIVIICVAAVGAGSNLLALHRRRQA
jgi:hypothetical protein